MHPTAVALSTLGVLASAFWLRFLLALVRHRRLGVALSELPDDPPAGGWPTLAVIFAARDEAEGVEAATRSMLSQDYPGAEVVAVDDRSTDATGAILDRLAAESPALRVVHVHDLPAGWLGKNHALQGASDSTRADWLLFTDADVVHAPGTWKRAIALAVAEGVDHVAVGPEVPTEGVGERLFLAMFGLMFLANAPGWKVEDPDSPAFVGIGAFNLVRAEAFRAIGGFEHIRLSVDDDVRLGQALKVAGYRTKLVGGLGAISVRWQVGMGGMVRGLEKNFFAAMDFRLGWAIIAATAILVLGAGPHVGLFVGPWWARALCATGVAALALLLSLTGRFAKLHAGYALTMPISAALCAWSLVRSTWLTLRRGGIRWRNHHYALDELRAHTRRRASWSREVWRSTR